VAGVSEGGRGGLPVLFIENAELTLYHCPMGVRGQTWTALRRGEKIPRGWGHGNHEAMVKGGRKERELGGIKILNEPKGFKINKEKIAHLLMVTGSYET